MRTKFIVNNEDKSYEKQWILTKWYEKTCFVLGILTFILLAVSFSASFMTGFLSAF